MMEPGMMEPGMMEPGMRGVGPDGQMQPVLPRTDFDEEPEEQTTAEEAKPEDDVDNPFIRTEDGRLRPKYYLFRFLDYKVAPGKRYKYRVQLALRNPSYQMDERLLQTPDVGLTRSRRTKWTEFTDEVFVPRDDRILLDRVVVSASASVEPKAEVILLKWLADYGKEAFLKQRIVRGQFAKFFEEKFDLTTIPEKRGGVLLDAAHQMRNRLKEDDSLIPVEFNTATTLLDVLGGQRMVRRFGRKTISLSAPSKILLMDPDGRLVVQTEAGDLAEAGKFEEKKEEEEDPRNNMGLPGGPMGEGYMPEDYEGMGLPGMGMEEMPPGAGGRKTGPTRRSSTRGNSSRNPRTGGRPPGA
ncbi:MAG: hypothetical protein HQ581_19520 [Planctomycetes bacterium]|nr:hypothetical protein [Planctomycetota bacterium]